jgi:hypothetical protein
MRAHTYSSYTYSSYTYSSFYSKRRKKAEMVHFESVIEVAF